MASFLQRQGQPRRSLRAVRLYRRQRHVQATLWQEYLFPFRMAWLLLSQPLLYPTLLLQEVICQKYWYMREHLLEPWIADQSEH